MLCPCPRDNMDANDRAEEKRRIREAKVILREQEKKHQRTTKVLILGCGEVRI